MCLFRFLVVHSHACAVLKTATYKLKNRSVASFSVNRVNSLTGTPSSKLLLFFCPAEYYEFYSRFISRSPHQQSPLSTIDASRTGASGLELQSGCISTKRKFVEVAKAGNIRIGASACTPSFFVIVLVSLACLISFYRCWCSCSSLYKLKVSVGTLFSSFPSSPFFVNVFTYLSYLHILYANPAVVYWMSYYCSIADFLSSPWIFYIVTVPLTASSVEHSVLHS